MMMEKMISVKLTEKELQELIDLMDYVLQDALLTGAKDDDEQQWAFGNSILEKLKAVQRQAQG
jgi:hypothetical protein